MPIVTYLTDADPRGRYDKIQFTRDDGSTVQIKLGSTYLLSDREITVCSPFAEFSYSSFTPEAPIIIAPPTTGGGGGGAVDLTAYQLRTEKGSAAGYAGLNGSAKVPVINLPNVEALTSGALTDGQVLKSLGGAGVWGSVATGRTAVFSQASAVGAVTGISGSYIVTQPGTIGLITLSAVSAPSGSAINVQFLKNGVVFATLQINDGSTTTATSTIGLPSVVPGDALQVNAVTVGTSLAAQGISAQVDIS